ncbi:MAG: NAD-dependent epimerase/dehydratase family protein [Pseudomonadales bacterium]|nr:NAD-dependent epimerase/dehydratase family protein [Pseudomonadales bacterium]
MTYKTNFQKAVVLGAGGFIGINLVQELVKQGYQTICFDKETSPHWPNSVETIIGEFSTMPQDLMYELNDALIFHLISSGRPSTQTQGIGVEIENDLIATIKYLEALHTRNNRWVYVSSGGTVYGATNKKLISETHITRPICSYGVTKLTLENYFYLYGRLHNLNYVIARLSNPYGPWQHPLRGQGVVMTLLHSLITDKPISIWGDGEVIRDYIYIQDAIEGLLIMADSASPAFLYNLASGKGLSINQLIEIASKILNTSPDIHYVDSRPSDVQYNVLDIDKISHELGWQPRVNIRDGLFKATKWIEQLIIKGS